MVLVGKWPFFQLFFLGNIGQENVFYDILERKKSFLGYKNKKCQTSKNSHFSKGVNPSFGPTMAIFPTFFQAIQSRRMSFTIFQNETTLYQAIKTRSAKSRKIDIFTNGLTHGLVHKWPFFQFFLRRYRPGKYLLRYSRTKKRLSGL